MPWSTVARGLCTDWFLTTTTIQRRLACFSWGWAGLASKGLAHTPTGSADFFLRSPVSAPAWDPSAGHTKCHDNEISVPIDRNWQSPNRLMASHNLWSFLTICSVSASVFRHESGRHVRTGATYVLIHCAPRVPGIFFAGHVHQHRDFQTCRLDLASVTSGGRAHF